MAATISAERVNRMISRIDRAGWTQFDIEGAVKDVNGTYTSQGESPAAVLVAAEQAFAALTTDQADTIETWMAEDIAAIDNIDPSTIFQPDPEDVDEDNQ